MHHLKAKYIHELSLFFMMGLAVLLGATIVQLYDSYTSLAISNNSIDKKKLLLSSETELLVKIRSDKATKVHPGNPNATGLSDLDNAFKEYRVTKFERLAHPSKKANTVAPLFNWYVATLPEFKRIAKAQGTNDSKDRIKSFADVLKKSKDVEVVENNHLITASVIPNDSFYSSMGTWGQTYADLWGVKQINSEIAWDKTVGDSHVVIANIDSGIDRAHPDLEGNVWTNQSEIPDNGIDDDTNGYVDDYYGWNWVSNNNNPMDDNGHGTHTAGTSAAVGNNSLGVTGVSWKSKVMGLKFLGSSGSGSLANAVKALQYAADNGAKISSNSWGCKCQSAAIDDAIAYEKSRNMVVVVAAGNDNSDALDHSPASTDGAITVAATTSANKLASFSNYGQRIDVVAPGVDILSLKSSIGSACGAASAIGVQYCRLSGTSMATPHVAGLAALMVTENPMLSSEQAGQLIQQSTYDLGDTGWDTSFGYGLINSGKSVETAHITPLIATISSPATRQAITGRYHDVTGSVGGEGFAKYTLEIAKSRERTPTWQTITSSTSEVTNGTLGTIDSSLFSDDMYTVRVSVHSNDGKIYQAAKYDIELKNFDIAVLSPSGSMSLGNIQIAASISSPTGLSVSHYTVDYGLGYSPTSFISAGITITNPGTSPIIGKQIASWDTKGLASGQVYALRVTATSSVGTTGSIISYITTDPDLVSGWPKYLPGDVCQVNCQGAPVQADLDGDGNRDIIIGSGTNQIFAYRHDGTNLPGFPATIAAGEYFKGPLTVTDLDNDGKNEIVATAIISAGRVHIYILRHDGTPYPGWTTPSLSDSTAVTISDLSPTIADLNGDGKKDLVTINVTSNIHTLHAFHLNGTELSGFPKNLPISTTSMHAAPTVADLNNDGRPEIAIGNNTGFYLFDNEGNLMPGWPFTASSYNGFSPHFQSTPAVGDLDGDGILEVIATAAPHLQSGVQLPVYAWKIDGTLLPGWPQATGQYGARRLNVPINSPSIADIDGDNKDEVIVGFNPLTVHELEGTKVIADISGNGPVAISDVLGDGNLKLTGGVRSWGKAVQLANSDGTEWWSKEFHGPSFMDPYTIADTNNDGRRELAAAASLTYQPGMNVYLWQLPGVVNYRADTWSMFGHDPARSNRFTAGVLPEIDSTTPNITLTSPSIGSTVNGTISLTANASDNYAVTRVEFYLDDKMQNTTTTIPYSYAWNSTAVINGTHIVYAKAYDAAGNVAISAKHAITVNNPDITPPSVTLTSPTNGARLSKNTTVIATATASDNVGVSKVEFYIGGVLKCTDTTTDYTCAIKLPTKATTTTIEAKAYDSAGNMTKTAITISVK